MQYFSLHLLLATLGETVSKPYRKLDNLVFVVQLKSRVQLPGRKARLHARADVQFFSCYPLLFFSALRVWLVSNNLEVKLIIPLGPLHL